MANTTGYGYLLGPAPQFFDANGKPLVGGKLFVYIAGTTTTAVTYSDFNRTENTSPVILNDLGTCMLIVPSANLYKIVLYDRKGNLLITRDNVGVSSEHKIIYMNANKVESSDSTVDVTETTDPDTGIVTYDISIKGEIDRATEAEKGLAGTIEAEKTRAEGVESTLSKSISDETKRAVAAEKASRTEIVAGDNITVGKTTGEDGHDIYTINGGSDDNDKVAVESGAVAGFLKDVLVSASDMVNLVPSGNQLKVNLTLPSDVVRDSAYTHIDAATEVPLIDGIASVGVSTKYAREDHVHPTDTSREDKANKTTVVLGTSNSKYPTDKAVAEFVNSSIATNTANYISNNGEPFTSVEQLEAYSGTVTNNDYAFVTGTDSEGNTYYDRYKATVSVGTVTWALEYRLNNSSFTAAQWSAINSGITSVLVAKIHEHSNKDVLDGITSAKVTSWDGKEDAFDILPTTKGGTGTNAASKSALTSTLINSLSTGSSTPKDADYYVSQYAGGGTTNTSYHRRPVSALWDYIKSKISSVLGLTASAYSGKASTAGTADKAVADNSGNNIETTYATKSKLSTHTSDTIVHITDAERTAWNAKASTSVATTSANGLMSKTDKAKLDGISSGANKADVSYASKKLTKTINGTTTDVVAASTIISDTNTFGNFAAVTDVNVSNINFHTYWQVAPTSSNQVFGFAVHPTNGKLYRIYNNKGTYSIYSYDTDTNTTYSFDGTYNSSNNKAATVSSVTTRISTAKNELTETIEAESSARESADTTLQSNIDAVDAKGIVINEINGENVICFE